MPTFLVSRWRRWRGSRPCRPCPPPTPPSPPPAAAAAAANGDISGGVTPSSSSSLVKAPPEAPVQAGSFTSSLGGGGRAMGGWNQEGTGRGVGFKPAGFVSGLGGHDDAPPGFWGHVGVPGGQAGAFLWVGNTG